MADWPVDDNHGDQGGFDDQFNTGGGDGGFNEEAMEETQGGPASGACHNCGLDGHFARDCDQPRKTGACFNCGEEGHNKAECTKPRQFNGECRLCQQPGHRAGDCPNKTKTCKQCLMEDDHDTIDCKNRKVLDHSKIPDMTEDQAWAMMKSASDDRDVDDFKAALQALSKAAPEMTYPRIEKELRRRGFKIFIIGLKKDVAPTHTTVNLQGEVGKTYTIGFYTSATCQRPVLLEAWPKDVEDNLNRLADAGILLERGVPVCSNCNELGHVKKNCPQDLVAIEGLKVVCALCNEEGHRVRDCQQERHTGGKPMECRICGGEHKAADCENKPKMFCRNCGEEGHMSKECTNERVMLCNNCSKAGHISKDCPEPKDWSRVKCKHCGEMGHASATRCKNPKPADDKNGYADNDHDGGGNAGWDEGNDSDLNKNHGDTTSAGWVNDDVGFAPAPVGPSMW